MKHRRPYLLCAFAPLRDTSQNGTQRGRDAKDFPINLPSVLTLLSSLFFLISTQAQDFGISRLETHLSDKDIPAAESVLQSRIAHYTKAKNYDSLAYYIPYAGRVERAKTDVASAQKVAEQLQATVQSGTDDPRIIKQSWLELSSFYEAAGQLTNGYAANKEAFAWAEKIPDKKGEELGLIQGNLGTYAQRMGDVLLSKTHHLKALSFYQSDPETTPESLNRVYNSLGGTMWYQSNLDSATYYYQQALEALSRTSPTLRNRYYRPALVQNNMAAISSIQGNPTEGIRLMRAAIENIGHYIDSVENGLHKNDAWEFKFQAIENLGGLYKEMGEFTKGLDLLTYAYRLKLSHLPADSPELFKAQILIGQTHLYLHNYEDAAYFLDQGLAALKATSGTYLFWAGDAHYYRAQTYFAQEDTAKAAAFFETSEAIYDRSFQGDYDGIFLGFLIEKSLFLAQVGQAEQAIVTARKGYDFTMKKYGEEALITFNQAENLADVYYRTGDYQTALEISNRSLDIINSPRMERAFLIDSIQLESRKPNAMLLKAKSAYQLQSKKDPGFLKQLLAQLDEAISILERKKSHMTGAEDLKVLMESHTALFEFAKKINLELYQQTQETHYLNQVLSFHESSLYNRIRTRLNSRETIQYSGVPAEVLAEENRLRSQMDDVLAASTGDQIQAFFAVDSAWNGFLAKLRKEYPRYYDMRFASIVVPLENIQSRIPAGTTVIRYLFVDEELFALVMDREALSIIPLTYSTVKDDIEVLNSPQNPETTSQKLHELYRHIWAPLEGKINHERIIIIPDRELFNLSFEMLTPTPINRFSDFKTHSLLSKYTFSYTYSLLLLNSEPRTSNYPHTYVAFAPGFSDQLKAQYRAQITDSVNLDQTYLTLLPQPFMLTLIDNMKGIFGGETYLDQHSTESAFKTRANQHKIIHVGTHAESNNLNPDLSRLIFSKPSGETLTEEDNSLYAYEIYNYELASHLTLLTACETGKPSYQPGEGMISIAHAFNYAGSESILTGLWKIDEKASAEITEQFFHYLLEGMAKDEALRLAKLDYLSVNTGRAAAPQFWAGLIIMGDASPIELYRKFSWWYGLVILGIVAGIVWRFQAGRQKG